MAKEIIELKCRDCQHFVMAGWWERYKICELTGYCVEPEESACISVKIKNETMKIYTTNNPPKAME